MKKKLNIVTVTAIGSKGYYGMEKIMGRANNPVRSVLNYASKHFAQDLPIVYVHDCLVTEGEFRDHDSRIIN